MTGLLLERHAFDLKGFCKPEYSGKERQIQGVRRYMGIFFAAGILD